VLSPVLPAPVTSTVNAPSSNIFDREEIRLPAVVELDS